METRLAFASLDSGARARASARARGSRGSRISRSAAPARVAAALVALTSGCGGRAVTPGKAPATAASAASAPSAPAAPDDWPEDVATAPCPLLRFPPVLGALRRPGTVATDVALDGDRAYVVFERAGADDVVSIIDVHDTAAPRVIGELAAPPGDDIRVEAHGANAYVLGERALWIVDVADPKRPRRLGSVAFPSPTVALAIAGATAYVATEHGLSIIDVHDGGAPAIVGETPAFVAAGDVAVRGTTVFVLDVGSSWRAAAGVPLLVAYDVATPRAPALLSRTPLPRSAHAFGIAGGVALVFCFSDALQVVDVHDPRAPRVAGSITVPGPEVMSAAGTMAYVGTISNGVTFLDVGDPDHPRAIGNAPGTGVRGIAVRDGVAFVGAYYDGFRVVDVRAPRSPHVAGGADIGTSAVPAVVLDAGSRLLVADGRHVLPLDVRVPERPEVGRSPYDLSVTALETDGPRVLLAGSRTLWTATLGPRGLESLRGVALGAVAVGGIARHGAVLLVAAGAEGVRVVDLPASGDPVVRGTVAAPGPARAIAVEGDRAYVATGPAGLTVWALEGAAMPRLVGRLALGGDAEDVVVRGPDAYVALATATSDELAVIDVHDPAVPTKRAAVTLHAPSGSHLTIALAGDHALVAGNGVEVVAIADPRAPAFLGHLLSGVPTGRVVVHGRYAYVPLVNFPVGGPVSALATLELCAP